MTDNDYKQTQDRISDEGGLLELTTRIVVACIAQNHHAAVKLPELISGTFNLLEAIASSKQVETIGEAKEPPRPAVSIRQSVTPDYIICLEDGKRFKALKGHLTALGMTPEQYRQKWNLPHDYPMVAPNFTALRSALAVESKLGSHRRRVRSAKAAG